MTTTTATADAPVVFPAPVHPLQRDVRALRAVVSSVHEDIGASQTRPARVKTSHRMPDCLTCKLNGQALAVMLCEDDGGGSFAFPPGPILRRQWD